MQHWITRIIPESPQVVLDSRLKNGSREFLIHWTGLSPAEASWLNEDSLKSRFPEFEFEEDHVSPGGSYATNTSPDPTTDQIPKIHTWKIWAAA